MTNLQRGFGEQQTLIADMIADGRITDKSDIYA